MGLGQRLYFTAPQQVAVREVPLPDPAAGQLLVKTSCSAISAGTELLLYRGQMPDEMALDATIKTHQQTVQYPLAYGYAAVGQVIGLGAGVDERWLGRWVFAFEPHGSHFVIAAENVLPLPKGVTPEDGVFLPNMETAVSFVMDSRPVIGERVAVFGQGVVGLLTTALLSQMPLTKLITLDHLPARREQSRRYGADVSLDPLSEESVAFLKDQQVDISFELSGNPAALNMAIASTGFGGRILIGSWYGRKQASLDLGGTFHRSHLTLISSQVSHLRAEWHSRWTKERRLQTAWRMIETFRPSELITHRIPIKQAAEAYQLLDQEPSAAVQVVLTYE